MKLLERSQGCGYREGVVFCNPVALPLQVMPTVGVHADDASGKKSANMQKHFRHLVNETASKQRFLQSLHRTSSAKEGSGSMPSALKQQTSANGGTVVTACVDSSCHHETSAQQALAIGPVAVKIEPGAFIKEERGLRHPESTSGDADGQAHLDLPDSACLPDSVGEELGHTPCFKADPDSLMADALPPSGTDSVAPTDMGVQPAVAAKQAPNQTAPDETPADHTEVVREFLDILGEAVDVETARGFVSRAGGHLGAAINSYYDNADVLLHSLPVHATAGAGATGQASSSETSAKSVTHSLAQSADKSAALGAADKPAGHEPAGKQVSNGKKRSAAAQARADDKLAKRQKAAPTAQRSIATFFGAGQSSVSRKPVNNTQQRPDGSAGNVPGAQAKRAQQGVTSPQQRIESLQQVVRHPQQGVKPVEQQAKLHGTPEQARATHACTVDLAGASVENEPVCVGVGDIVRNEQAIGPTSPQAVPLPPSLPHQVFSHEVGESTEAEGAQPSQPRVHPFFGKGRRQVKNTPARVVDHSNADSAATTARQAKGSAKGPPSTQSEGKVPLLKEEQSPRNKPVTKAQPEPSRDVPADAVLLPTSEYDPVKMAVWEAGQATPYRHISRAFQAMESTTKRLRIGDAIANMFRSILALSPGRHTYCQKCNDGPGPTIASLYPCMLICCTCHTAGHSCTSV